MSKLSIIIPVFDSWGGQNTKKNLKTCIDSIDFDAEIILVGNVYLAETKTIHVPDETTISRKINIGAKEASNKILVFMRDYNFLYPGWYEGWKKFGWDWDVGMNVILNNDLTRYRDFCFWEAPNTQSWIQHDKPWPNGKLRNGRPKLANYDETQTSLMYVSGMYWLAKKSFMLENPFDESLNHGESEDVEWSDRVRDKWVYRMNQYSKTGMMKYKDRILN